MLLVKVNKKDSKFLSSYTKYSFDNRYICTKQGKIYLVKIVRYSYYLCYELKSYTDRQGYVEYVLTDTDGVKKHVMIHRVVASLFIHNRNKHKTQVNHIDGNKQHNYIDNLEWMTPSENIFHMHQMYKAKRRKEQEEKDKARKEALAIKLELKKKHKNIH